MCRSIRQLRRSDDAGPATTGEAHAAALQYVRKISGFREPSARNAEAFRDAIDEIAHATQHLLEAIGTDVTEGPDGFLYFSTSNGKATDKIVRVRPQ